MEITKFLNNLLTNFFKNNNINKILLYRLFGKVPNFQMLKNAQTK